MKRKVLASLLLIAVVMGLVGAGTMAYFSDTETSSGNTFTAGTFDLQLQDANETWSDGVSATWQSPPNWAPGDPEVVAELEMKDIGSVGADLVAIHAANLSEADNGYNEPEGSGSANDISNHIYVTWLQYTEGGSYLYGNLAPWVATIMGDKTAPLTLNEFATSPYSLVFWLAGWPPTADYLAANGASVEKIKLGFTFEPNAGNAYQSDTASFDLTVTAVQDYSQVTLLGKGPSGLCYGYGEAQ